MIPKDKQIAKFSPKCIIGGKIFKDFSGPA